MYFFKFSCIFISIASLLSAGFDNQEIAKSKEYQAWLKGRNVQEQSSADLNPEDVLLPKAPYGVGYQEFVISKTGAQKFHDNGQNACPDPQTNPTQRISVWFPVSKKKAEHKPLVSYYMSNCGNGSDTGAPNPPGIVVSSTLAPQLSIVGGPSGVHDPSLLAVDGSNLSLAKMVDKRHGKFPIILYSIGNDAEPWIGALMLERLASYGFIIVAPYHIGNSYKDVSFSTDLAINDPILIPTRIQQLEFTLSWFLHELKCPHSKFYRRGNKDQIGFMGYSLGATTFLSWFPVNPLFKAAFLAQPPTFMFNLDFEQMATITIPTFIEASSDSDTPGAVLSMVSAVEEFPVYEALGTAPKHKWLIETQGERHLTPINPCHDVQYFFQAIANTPGVSDVPLASANLFTFLWNNDGCTYFNPLKPLTPQQSIDILSLYQVSFFKVNVEKDKKYKKLLDVCYAIEKQLPIVYYHNKSIEVPFIVSPISVPTTVPAP